MKANAFSLGLFLFLCVVKHAAAAEPSYLPVCEPAKKSVRLMVVIGKSATVKLKSGCWSEMVIVSRDAEYLEVTHIGGDRVSYLLSDGKSVVSVVRTGVGHGSDRNKYEYGINMDATRRRLRMTGEGTLMLKAVGATPGVNI